MKTIYVFIFLLLVILAGCVKPAQLPGENNQAKKNCAALNGFACKSNEECRGSLLQSLDSKNCCNIKCIAKTDSMEIPKFDFGKTDGDNALGELK